MKLKRMLRTIIEKRSKQRLSINKPLISMDLEKITDLNIEWNTNTVVPTNPFRTQYKINTQSGM